MFVDAVKISKNYLIRQPSLSGPVWGNMWEELWALSSIFNLSFLSELYISCSIELVKLCRDCSIKEKCDNGSASLVLVCFDLFMDQRTRTAFKIGAQLDHAFVKSFKL